MKLSPKDFAQIARQIRLLVLDVDGVLTDGRLYYGTDGGEWKAFNTLDGHGIKMLQKTGVHVAIITGRSSEPVARRARELGVELLKQGREDKLVALQELLQEHPVALKNIAFMGDDFPDLTAMTRIGLPLTVPNAHPLVKQNAAWQSQARGGEGAVREACEMLMQAQDTYNSAVTAYLVDHS